MKINKAKYYIKHSKFNAAFFLLVIITGLSAVFFNTGIQKNVDIKVFAVETSNVVFVAPDGVAINTGTREKPKDIDSAIAAALPGQKIIVTEGRYRFSAQLRIKDNNNGTEAAKKYLIADPYAISRPVFDFEKQKFGMRIYGSYWHIKGFDITNTGDDTKGLQIDGHYNIIEEINAYSNGDTGIQISGQSANWADKDTLWPSNNLVLNCTSYHNADPKCENADGFAAKISVGEGNVFRGCIAYENMDDGFDLYAKVTDGSNAYPTGNIGTVTIEDCVTFRNGQVPGNSGKGDGNGFKLGGSNMGDHIIRNSISYDNPSKGIDSNSAPAVKVYDCTTFNNGTYNLRLYYQSSSDTRADVTATDYRAEGILSVKTKSGGSNDQIMNLKQSPAISSENNYLYASGTSKNSKGATVTASVFEKTDTSVMLERNGDGTINMKGLLQPKTSAPLKSGARIINNPSEHLAPTPDSSIPAPIKEPGDEEPGDENPDIEEPGDENPDIEEPGGEEQTDGDKTGDETNNNNSSEDTENDKKGCASNTSGGLFILWLTVCIILFNKSR